MALSRSVSRPVQRQRLGRRLLRLPADRLPHSSPPARYGSLRPRVRLHVGVGRAEERLRALDGEALDDVDVLAAAMEAPPGVALERLGTLTRITLLPAERTTS